MTYRGRAIPALPALTTLAALLTTFCPYSAHAQTGWKPAPAPLMTRWAKDVSPTNALPDYPRPQMVRKTWQSLNGLWDYSLTSADASAAPAAMTGRILVPFPYEAALSGAGKPSIPTQRLWYRRRFSVPAGWKGQRILLHFGAVNYASAVSVNGQTVGTHRGGYDSFTFDITGRLKTDAGQTNEIAVSVTNPLKTDVPDAQVVGKQRVRPGGIFYTAATGIWQSVWLEPVPVQHIETLKITPDIDASQMRLSVPSSVALPLTVTVLDGGKILATATGKTNAEMRLPVRNPKLWSPASPHLYGLKVTLGIGKNADSVTSYFAMRKIALGKDREGRQRIFLNNKFVFEVGALDQGYWPDGIYTAPTDAALRYDIEIAKKLGYNLLRKHAKVEPDRWYYHADRLGMLVWQDMPQMFGGRGGILSDDAKKQFLTEWQRIIAQHYNSPSIVVWTTFNEGWGQHDTPLVVAQTRKWDGTRLVNNASGWTDQKVGDMHDTHAYPVPRSNTPEADRAAVCGEYGGVTLNVPGHRWNDRVMGYGATLQSSWQATRRFQTLLTDAWNLKDAPGASAVVYTQLTDVEQEINGILTYDRAVMKLNTPIVAAAHRGVFLPLGPDPNPNPQLVPTADDEPIVWRYTTDKPADSWTAVDFQDTDWKTGPAPFGNDAGGVRTNWKTSDIWIRRTFTLPTAIPANLVLLVKHDENAEIYINGVPAGSATGFTGEYAEVPLSAEARAALKSGTNTFAVHCHQTIGGQSIDVGLIAAPKK